MPACHDLGRMPILLTRFQTACTALTAVVSSGEMTNTLRFTQTKRFHRNGIDYRTAIHYPAIETESDIPAPDRPADTALFQHRGEIAKPGCTGFRRSVSR